MKLRDRSGKPCMRDIVQFVPYRDFKNVSYNCLPCPGCTHLIARVQRLSTYNVFETSFTFILTLFLTHLCTEIEVQRLRVTPKSGFPKVLRPRTPVCKSAFSRTPTLCRNNFFAQPGRKDNDTKREMNDVESSLMVQCTQLTTSMGRIGMFYAAQFINSQSYFCKVNS